MIKCIEEVGRVFNVIHILRIKTLVSQQVNIVVIENFHSVRTTREQQ